TLTASSAALLSCRRTTFFRSSSVLTNQTIILAHPSHPGLQLLNLLLASFHGDLLRFIQTVLQVFDSLLHVLLHAFQVSAGVLLFLQLLCHHGRISNGLLGLILTLQGVDGPLQFAFNVRFDLIEL
uniref:Uncharacterized protein n=1 Tax=Takifugu rubripes TaxID=31033 RepID=A0A3B5JUV1_TAKRU